MAFYQRLICRRLLSCRSRPTATTGKILHPSHVKKQNNFSSCPLLMLPPSFNDDTSSSSSMNYNFYSIAEDRVLTPRPHRITPLLPIKPIQDLKFCGSSHGWLALFNRRTFELFLYDPISHRHINLPPFHHLPNFSTDHNRTVTKLILSSSPDDDDNCCAVMIYNCRSTLAFCCPGHSKEWTPIGKTHKTSYGDVVYSSRQNLFFALNCQDRELETWCLSHDPLMIKTIKTDKNKYYYYDYSDMSPKDRLPHHMKYLVVADDDDDDVLLLVTRYVMPHVAPDGSYVQYYHHSPCDLYPHMTFDFSIRVYDQEEGDLKPLAKASLGDLALFIGCHSHSFALSTTRFPGLKPNSIYFTDPYETSYDPSSDKLFGGHDIGIFNCENKTVSPCYYPCDVRSLKRVVPLPMWFFPRGLSSG